MDSKNYLAIGLMSGTSLDGVDGVLLHTDGHSHVQVLAHAYAPYTDTFRSRLMAVARGDVPLNEVLRVEQAFTHESIHMVEKLLVHEVLQTEGTVEPLKVDVIGFHGQTIRHLPDEGLTWQLGDANLMAEKTGVPVVADFRRRDMAAGGQGAPLASLFHQVMLQNHGTPAAILNIGGVANLTWVGPDGSVIGSDTGPGGGLLDVWMQQNHNKPYDADGALSLAGKADTARVEKYISQHWFFQGRFPKSADRYDFDNFPLEGLAPENVPATLVHLTVAGAARVLHAMPEAPKTLWVCGGGSRNKALMAGLEQHVQDVRHVEDLGMAPDEVEAACFAWLAVRRLLGLPTTRTQVTGAAHPTCGGVLTAHALDY